METEAKSSPLPTTTKQPQLTSKKSFITSLMEAAGSSSFHRAPSFKEDSYFSSQLKPHQAKALKQLKHKLIQRQSEEDGEEASHVITMWSVPLLSPVDPRADVILLKFLRARDFKVEDSYAMLLKCLTWRQHFGADSILDEDMSSEFKELEGAVAYLHGFDRAGHPVCYNAYGVFKDRSMFEKYIGDGGGDGDNNEKLQKFLRWRVQVLERSIKMLELKPGGVNSIIQVTDLKDMPKRELRVVSNHILSLFQDNYPEMVARKIFINVPWYFSFLYSMFSPFLTKRTKSKFVISKEGDVAESLYKFIRPEDIPVQYGGLSLPGDHLNGPPKPASEFSVKGGEKVNIQIEGIEDGATVSWEIVVGGWELVYSAEFVPNAENSYTIAVEKPRLVISSDEEGAVRNSYTATEAGKLVLCVDNSASRKKKVAAYRYVVCKSSSLVCA